MLPALLLASALSSQQVYWANEAFKVGEPYDLGSTLVGISGQESSYCRFKVNRWSRGCTGIKRSTARLFDPSVTRLQLTQDNARNLRDGMAYLLYCRDNTAGWSEMVYCYHYGLPAELAVQTETEIVSDGYVKAIQRRMKEIRVSND